MPFHTPTQLFVLCAVAVGGWLLGFLVHPDAARQRGTIQRLSRDLAALRSDAQIRLRDASRSNARLELTKRELTERLDAAEAEIAELRGEPAPDVDTPAELERANPATTPVVPPPLPTRTPAPIGAAVPPEPVGGWLRGGARDDLTRIEGIDTPTSIRLFALGITQYADLERLSDKEVTALEARLMLPEGYIADHRWRPQAMRLRTSVEI